MPDTPPNRPGRPPGSDAFAWRAFFQHSTTPVFVLGKGRRLRFANAAWEGLTGVALADAAGLVCSDRRHAAPLAAALAPTPEARAGRSDTARRAPPSARAGPPWWDVTFVPLAGTDALVGFIAVVGGPAPAAARAVPPAVAALRAKHAAHYTPDLFAGPAPATRRFVGLLRHAASSPGVPVWLVGEPGSGKETAARVIHHAGATRDRAFAAIDCAGLQPYLVESLLFGHGGVADTGHVGTVYLKDPAALPRDLQLRLADLVTEGGPRLVCGSANTAAAEVAAGRLVPVFHTALSVLELPVPPLRDRLADLPRLAAGVPLDPAALDLLAAQPWPGNLRELADVLRGAAASAGGGPVKAEHLPREFRVRAGIVPPAVGPRAITLDPILEAVERRLIALALRRAGDNQTKAAELLGVFRARLGRRLEALGIGKPGDGS
jgi:transcriptional regulator with PAS, ATPase and Fis domain